MPTTQQFHEGQDVEVGLTIGITPDWRKATIIAQFIDRDARFRKPDAWVVRFPDGSRAVFDAEHIMAVTP